jgi:hypothetical protein
LEDNFTQFNAAECKEATSTTIIGTMVSSVGGSLNDSTSSEWTAGFHDIDAKPGFRYRPTMLPI